MFGPVWIALGREAGGTRAFALEGEVLRAEARHESEAAALAALNVDTELLLRIGNGPADHVPCPVLPDEAKGLPVITQDRPADILGGWVRLWVAGFLARHAGWDGVVCATEGDISHWIHLSAGEIVSCASFLTGRLIAALQGSETPDPAAMADSQSRPERLAQHLRQAEISGSAAAITGTLIGAELAASRAYWLGQRVAVIAPEAEMSAYAQALTAQGVPVTACRPADLIADGLAALGRASGIVSA